MKIRIENPTPDHVNFLARNLRDVDVKEMWLMHRYTPLPAIRSGVALSDRCSVVVCDGTPVIIFGIEGEGLSDTANVWMLATDQISRIAKTVQARARFVFLELIQGYDLVYNYVYTENKIALRWLKHLGFKIFPAEPTGPDSALFHRVEYKRS